jgi:plastocyanin domain-containing protein
MPNAVTAVCVYAALLGVLSAPGCSKSEDKEVAASAAAAAQVAMPPAPEGARQVKVIVDAKGFTPSEVKADKGKPLSLVFVRTTEGTCAKQVVFPELKLEKDLPLSTAVTVDVPTGEARTLTFQCGMAMYKSAVLIQ